jgi:hypothetical protein
MPLLATAYQRVRAHPTLAALLDGLPMRVGLLDGRTRMLPFRLWRLARLWNPLPALRTESEEAFSAYRGGDVVDVGAYEGWYSLLLAPRPHQATPCCRSSPIRPPSPSSSTCRHR